MAKSALVLPAPARPRHRRHPVRTGMLNAVAKLGSAVTLAALVVVAATAAGLTAGPPEPPTRTVTFEMAR